MGGPGSGGNSIRLSDTIENNIKYRVCNVCNTKKDLESGFYSRHKKSIKKNPHSFNEKWFTLECKECARIRTAYIPKKNPKTTAKYQNLEGVKVNKLTCIERRPSPSPKTAKGLHYLFRCECGAEKVLPASVVVRGTTKSCGAILHKKEFNKKNIVDIDVQGFNYVYVTYRRNARLRNEMIFDLSKEYFRSLIEAPCDGCGVEKYNTFTNHYTGGTYGYNGIDRIHNELGYIPGNCRSFCRICNVAKATLSENDWQEWIKRIVNFNKEKKTSNDQ
jgi:hypothetical protein